MTLQRIALRCQALSPIATPPAWAPRQVLTDQQTALKALTTNDVALKTEMGGHGSNCRTGGRTIQEGKLWDAVTNNVKALNRCD